MLKSDAPLFFGLFLLTITVTLAAPAVVLSGLAILVIYSVGKALLVRARLIRDENRTGR